MLVSPSCVVPKQAQTKQALGLYGLTGWNASLLGANNETAGIDINGEIGHYLFVLAPTAKCVSVSGNWTGYPKIISGKLPPGIEFDMSNRIKGVPTERGHYILKIEMNTIKCNDSSYKGITQVLRFHIMSKGCTIN